MVHALDKSRSFLRPNGNLLNVHDLPRPPRIEVHTPVAEYFAGYLLSYIDFRDLRLAEEALEQVVEDGQFSILGEHLFNYPICADTFADLEDLLSESWDDSYLTEGTANRIKELIRMAEDEAKIVLGLTARLTILSRMDSVE